MSKQPEFAAPHSLSTIASVLIVEDEELFAVAVRKRLEKAGYRCRIAHSLSDAVTALATEPPDLALLDLRLPDGNGLTFLERVQTLESARFPVIVLTAYGEISDAVLAIKQGAADYLKKPIDLDELAFAIDKVLQESALRHRLVYSQQRDLHALEGSSLLGDSDAIRQVREQIRRLANLETPSGEPLPTVLIRGETGTGKDLAARLLHTLGSRADQPFVQIDCATLPRDLMDAELFGHDKGAFTGAHGARAGLIEAAEGGAVFLDEIGEIAPELQAKLLTVIERRRSRRIGSVREHVVAARFIAATNRNLEEMMATGRFRSDLYYRLNVVTLTLPTLRARALDVPLLATHFLHSTCRRYGLELPNLAPSALAALTVYAWPGNVRELKHLVERAALLSRGGEISESTLGLPANPAAGKAPPDAMDGLTLDRAERRMIEHALQASRGNVSQAARRLGVSRMTMRYRMEKHGLKDE